MFKVEVMAASQNPRGKKIITFRLTYPRIIHAEMMTHRVFSRNAASSRAIPIEKMIESIENNMFIPIGFQKAHKGMQGDEYFEGYDLVKAQDLWIKAAKSAIAHAKEMKELGITKQLVNRILEPFQYYTVLLTGTEFFNFFDLRCPKFSVNKEIFLSKKSLLEKYPDCDLSTVVNKSPAEIHIQRIAEMMYDAYNSADYKLLQYDEWHIPFENEIDSDNLEIKLKVATAKAARVSYTTVGGGRKTTIEEDIALHDRLKEEGHASPFEHCAMASFYNSYFANFGDFESYRHKLYL